MSEFANYYLEHFWKLLNNFWGFIVSTFGAVWKIFAEDIPDYFNDMVQAAPYFDFWGWLLLIIVTLINLTFWFFVIYKCVQLIRRYIVFRGRNVDKDKLIEEIARAKQQIAELTKEKNRLFELKAGLYPGDSGVATYPASGEVISGEVVANSADKLAIPSRFTKLIAIDQTYALGKYYADMGESKPTLSEIILRFKNYSASRLHLYYEEHTVRCFIAGMAASKVLILEGISGTGKTSLPYAFGHFFNNPVSIVSVQPSWRDRADLVGYLNEFSKQYNETDFLAAVYNADYRDDPCFIVLDEMNLARIEYYFAEFLSVMEMPDYSEWLIDVVPRIQENDPKLLKDGKILVPQNLWFIGTANQDDSTFTVTDKVYDRTITLDLNKRADYFDAPLTDSLDISVDYLQMLFDKAIEENQISDRCRDNIQFLDSFLAEKFKITFGNRIKRQIDRFVPVYVACGGSEIEAVDFLIMSKILRKLTSLNLTFLTKELNELIALLDKKFGKNTMPRCIEYIKYLLRTV